MRNFPDKLILRALAPDEIQALGGSAALYEVRESFSFDSALLGQISVPVGLITDFASIPRAALWYMKDDDPGILFPSVVHDFLYSMQGVLPVTGKTYTREQADGVLREAMEVCGARGDQIAAVYRAVRWFGGFHWNPRQQNSSVKPLQP